MAVKADAGRKRQVVNSARGNRSMYAYDADGRLTVMTLPSGKEVTYGYNEHLADSVTVHSTTILSGATYDPFGPVSGWSWGNSTAHSRSFDLRGLMDSQSVVTDTRTLGYDDAGQLITLDDARHDLGFDYNALGQLTDFTASGSAPLPAAQDFTYDENGNRESLTEGGTYTYSLVTNSNRLTSTTGPTAKTYTYDAAGNATSDNIHSYGYDDRGRLTNVDSGSVTYAHNGQGQRVLKDDGTETLFAYDEAGQPIGEYDASGTALQETVWFNGMPVAVLVGANNYYVHTDHLGTPRVISNGNTVIWRWESDPFGTTLPQEDPDGDMTDFTYNLRFPGQYYDQETGLHYNYYRTYDPATGRYMESDPIGLAAGPNTYSYVSNIPTMRTDRFGLYEGGGISEVLPGYDYQSYLDQLSDPDYVARQREYFQDLAECGAEGRACIDRCISDNYGDLYGYAESLNPITITSLALSEAAEVAGDSLRSQARRNLYSRSYYDGVRQMRLYNTLTRVNNAVLVAGVGAIAFQATAYTRCAMECAK